MIPTAVIDTRDGDDPERPAPGRRTARLSLAALAVGSILMMSCSGPDSASTGVARDATGEAPASDEATLSDGEPASGNESAADASATPVAVPPLEVAEALAAERKQTFTASLDLRVEGLDDALRSAGSAIEALGGFASGEDVDLGGARRALITYRVPATQFRSALDALSGVGDLQSQEVRGTDVTATYADLEGRVMTLRTSISRLQGFLAEATDANQVALLEGELTRRESELESVESQRRVLADQVELSTITVSLDAATTDAPVSDDRTLPSFLGGLESGWDALLAGGAVILAAAGFLLPFVPVSLLLFVGFRWLARRRRQPEMA